MKNTVSHYIPLPNPLTSTAPHAFSNNLTMPWRARCVATRTAGSASGLGKRADSNTGTTPQADSTIEPQTWRSRSRLCSRPQVDSEFFMTSPPFMMNGIVEMSSLRGSASYHFGLAPMVVMSSSGLPSITKMSA